MLSLPREGGGALAKDPGISWLGLQEMSPREGEKYLEYLALKSSKTAVRVCFSFTRPSYNDAKDSQRTSNVKLQGVSLPPVAMCTNWNKDQLVTSGCSWDPSSKKSECGAKQCTIQTMLGVPF